MSAKSITSYIESKKPIVQAVDDFAREKKLSAGTKPIIAFANEVLEDRTLTRGNVRRLIELDRELLQTSIETATKLNELCLHLLLPGKEISEIEQLSQQLSKSKDPLAKIRFLQYLDALNPSPNDNALIQQCAAFAANPNIHHPTVLSELQTLPMDQRKNLFVQSLPFFRHKDAGYQGSCILTSLAAIPPGSVPDTVILRLAFVLAGIVGNQERELTLRIIMSLPMKNLTVDAITKIGHQLDDKGIVTLLSTWEILKLIKNQTTLTAGEITEMAGILNLTGETGQKDILEIASLLPAGLCNSQMLHNVYNLFAHKDFRTIANLKERLHEMSSSELASFLNTYRGL